MTVKRVLLIDSSALINSSFSFSESSHYLMTFECFGELKSLEVRLLAENAQQQGFLELKSPCPASIQKTLELLERIGDRRLSNADISLIALALELKDKKRDFQAITDDYSVQNVLKILKIPFSSILQERIKKARRWKTPNK